MLRYSRATLLSVNMVRDQDCARRLPSEISGQFRKCHLLDAALDIDDSAQLGRSGHRELAVPVLTAAPEDQSPCVIVRKIRRRLGAVIAAVATWCLVAFQRSSAPQLLLVMLAQSLVPFRREFPAQSAGQEDLGRSDLIIPPKTCSPSCASPLVLCKRKASTGERRYLPCIRTLVRNDTPSPDANSACRESATMAPWSVVVLRSACAGAPAPKRRR